MMEEVFEIPEKVRKIAVVRANVLGDFIFVLPALYALKQKFTDAEIVYLGNAWHKSFLENRPGPVDRVVVIPRCTGMPHESHQIENEKEVKDFFSAMKNEQFDLAFQMHGGGKNSNPFTLQLGAKYTIGLRTPDAIPLDINVPYCLYQNEVLRYLEVVAAVGAKTADFEPEINVTESDYYELKFAVPEIPKPYVILHPGASDPRRRWPAEKFARVGDRLAERGLSVLVTGKGKEKEVVDKVVANMKSPATNLCDKISLNGLAALIKGADLMISNDTGPLHLARALKTPNVGIYWCSNMLMSGPLSSTLNRTIARWSPMCPLCGVDCSIVDAQKSTGACNHEASFVASVSEEDVMTQAEELLKIKEPGYLKLAV